LHALKNPKQNTTTLVVKSVNSKVENKEPSFFVEELTDDATNTDLGIEDAKNLIEDLFFKLYGTFITIE